jgi:hypothetical protein
MYTNLLQEHCELIYMTDMYYIYMNDVFMVAQAANRLDKIQALENTT